MPRSLARLRHPVNQDGLINYFIRVGLIRRVATNRYLLPSESLLQGLRLTRSNILSDFSTQVSPGMYLPNDSAIAALAAITSQTLPVEDTEPEPLRTLERHPYHSQSRDYSSYLLEIAEDSDGVRRSFGLEWEIYALTSEQEDKLARLLDTLPAHITERDGSLLNSGIELVFMPLSKDRYIATFIALKNFCTENNIRMDNTGAHTTYGVNNSSATREDLQIRLNRVALAVKAVGTQRAIASIFGRDFSSYCQLPISTTYCAHSNAFSTSRGGSAWECRLINWKADVLKVVEFLGSIEFVFRRRVVSSDFMKVFSILGSDTGEA